MSERFKLQMDSISSKNSQFCIIDTEQDVLTIYNDLGSVYFSSAPALCDLLNELNDENKKLKR